MEQESRTFMPWSHVVSLIYAQLTHAVSLNDVCDALRLHSGPLSAIRGATPPSKNALSHANRERDPKMAEALFWTMLEQLQHTHPGFGARRRPGICLRAQTPDSCGRFDHHSTGGPVYGLGQTSSPQARRHKCHVRLNLQSFLPGCVIVGSAAEHDNRRASELCANVHAGEIVVFDKAYLDFAHLADLSTREVFWVTRAKDNLQFRVVRKLQNGTFGPILRDDLIQLTGPAAKDYPVGLRRVLAMVELDGQLREMVFLTNNFT
jgi:hypothetical protein